MEIDDYIEHIKNSLARADEGLSNLPESIYNPDILKGMSSDSVRHFLNNVVGVPDLRYLEIGTWQGSTLCSAAYRTEGTFYAIDLFEGAFKQNLETGRSVREVLFENLTKFELKDKITFFNADSSTFDLSKIPDKINVYFYDADHTFEDQQNALVHFKPILADVFIFIVDDYRDRGADVPSAASMGTEAGIAAGNFEILFSIEAPRGKYHQGLGIFLLKKG